MSALGTLDGRTDPVHWRLDGRLGWRAGRWDLVEEVDGELRLTLLPDPSRPVLELVGAEGAAALRDVAVDDDDRVWLLDVAGARVLRSDPCCDSFVPVPCVGGVGSGPRALRDPEGLEVSGGLLYVADTGNRRVQVFDLRRMLLLQVWGPLDADGAPVAPDRPGVPAGDQACAVPEEPVFPVGTWEPVAVAVAPRGGRRYVLDRAGHRVHVIDGQGRWLGAFGQDVLTAPSSLAVDAAGRVFVADRAAVPVFDPGGRLIEVVEAPARPGAPRGRWRPGPVAVDGDGNLYVSDLAANRLCRYRCAGRPGTPVWIAAGTCATPRQLRALAFDHAGAPLLLPADRAAVVRLRECRFAEVGQVRTDALDSQLPGCVWHRVTLTGTLPDACLVRVHTLTAETVLGDAELDALPEDAWAPAATWTGPDGAGVERPWDCLVRGAPGRYLWLRLTLVAPGQATPAVGGVEVFYPRRSSLGLLPAVFRSEPDTADFLDRFLSITDILFGRLEATLDALGAYVDPAAAPSVPGRDFLAWLGSWFGLDLRSEPRERVRRRLVGAAAELLAVRGTPAGLRRLLRILLDLDDGELPGAPAVVEDVQVRRWLQLGAGRLDSCGWLWGRRVVDRLQLEEHSRIGEFRLVDTGDPLRDPFHERAHGFTVFLPAVRGLDERRARVIERAVREYAPASSVPQVEVVSGRMRVGVQSTVGADAVLGDYPEGMTLGEGQLGRDSVLADDGPAPPGVAVGRSALIGGGRL
jgi:phage tail-like protein